MKITLKILSIFLIFLQASFVYAGDIRVMVTPFGGDGDDKALNQKAADICAAEVARSKGFVSMPPGDLFGDIEKTDTLDHVLKMYRAADVIVTGAASRVGEMVKVGVRLEPAIRLKADSETDYSFVVKCEELRMEEVLKELMRQLLEKVAKAGVVCADVVSDPDEPAVMYILKATDGRYVAVEMAYEKGVSDPDIVSVNILPPEGIDGNAATRIGIMSAEGKEVGVEFDYRAGNLEGVTVYAPRPDVSKGAVCPESFTLKSEVGYLLGFDFEWKDDGSVVNVKIGPKVNPFTGRDEAAG